MLVGVAGSGKTMAAHAIAHSAGAAFFDLSPQTTDGQWPGKAAATMVGWTFCPALCCGTGMSTGSSFQSTIESETAHPAAVIADRTHAGAHGGAVCQAAGAICDLHQRAGEGDGR